MRYKLMLTTEDGELLETWTVCLAKQVETGDEYNISNNMAASALIGDMRFEIAASDKRAGVTS